MRADLDISQTVLKNQSQISSANNSFLGQTKKVSLINSNSQQFSNENDKSTAKKKSNQRYLINNNYSEVQAPLSLNGSVCDLLSSLMNQCDLSLDNQSVNYTKFEVKAPKYPLPDFALQYQ